MAALRPCTPSGLSAAPVPSSILRLAPRSSALPLGLGGRSTVKPISLRIRARSGAAADQPAAKPEVPDEMYDVPNFREEQDKIDEYCAKISNASFLHLEATALSRYLFTVAKKSVKLASIVMDCAVLSPGTPHEVSLDAIKEILQKHVRIFASTAEDVYHKKVTRESIVSFIDALDGVAGMSYVIAQVTRWSLQCGRDCDADRADAEYQRKMGNLKSTFKTAQPYDAYKILETTVTAALSLTQSCVILMTVDRKHALLGLIPGATMAVTDDYGFGK